MFLSLDPLHDELRLRVGKLDQRKQLNVSFGTQKIYKNGIGILQ